MTVPPFGADAVVLAGGRGRRLGGADKAMLDIAGRTSLQRVLDALGEVQRIVVVGPERDVTTPVRWTREQPARSGPASALRAGIALTSAPVVVVLAADTPLVRGSTVRRLLDAIGTSDGALLVDGEGRDQPLVGAYRRSAVAGRPGSSLRWLLGGLDLNRLPDTEAVSLDVDTAADLARVRARLRG